MSVEYPGTDFAEIAGSGGSVATCHPLESRQIGGWPDWFLRVFRELLTVVLSQEVMP